MSSSDRRGFVAGLAGTLTLAACGFEPVYAPGGRAEGIHGRIEVEPPRDEAGFALVRQLEARLGQPRDPRWRLEAEIGVDQTRLGITSGQVITRISLRGRARYVLRDIRTGDVVLRDGVDSFTSYSATGTPFSTQVARQDALDRLMVILADQIVSELLVRSGDWVE